MIYPDFDPLYFSIRHEIELTEGVCINCKKSYPINIPIISKDIVGFTQADHGCGEKYIQVVFKPRKDDPFWD